MIAQSLRYWIADKLTGGALTANHHQRLAMFETWDLLAERGELAEAQADALAKDVERLETARADWATRAIAAKTEAAKFSLALLDISKMPTPRANATVRRMARIAEEAVKP